MSLWLADVVQAREALRVSADGVLLPYRRQYVVAGPDYVRELSLDPDDPAWAACGHDLVAAYGSSAWLDLAWRRLMAPAETFAGSGGRRVGRQRPAAHA